MIEASACAALSTATHCVDLLAFDDPFLKVILAAFGVLTFVRVIMAILRSSPL